MLARLTRIEVTAAPQEGAFMSVASPAELAFGHARLRPACSPRHVFGLRFRAVAARRTRTRRFPVETRVADLLSRMTLDEKIAQTLAVWQQKRTLVDASGNFDAVEGRAPCCRTASARSRASSDGIERGKRRSPRETVEFANAIQKWVLENTRLGIPVMFHEEALHGFVAPQATHFPVPHRPRRAPGTRRWSSAR